jgi:hypothetical protein
MIICTREEQKHREEHCKESTKKAMSSKQRVDQ